MGLLDHVVTLFLVFKETLHCTTYWLHFSTLTFNIFLLILCKWLLSNNPSDGILNLFSVIYRNWSWLGWIFHTLLQTFHWTDVKIVTQTSCHVRRSIMLILLLSSKGWRAVMPDESVPPISSQARNDLYPQSHVCNCIDCTGALISLDLVVCRKI